jgi:isoleucyl-tRNA synthetase
MLDENGREMHGSWGNLIPADEAFERMGADVMRWQYCQQPPDRNLLFGYGPAHEIERKLLTLWNSVSFFLTYASIESFEPRYEELEAGPPREPLRLLDRWLLARTQAFLADAERGYEAFLTVNVIRAFDAFLEDLSNWYIRRSRRRFWEEADAAAFGTLWYALVQAVRAISPVTPFLAEFLWANLVGRSDGSAPESVFLAGWPSRNPDLVDPALEADVAVVRQVVELGRAARQAAGIKLRQPLRRVVVVADSEQRSSVTRLVEEIVSELNVKQLDFADDPGRVADLKVTPKLDLVGPRLGAQLPELRRLLAEREFTLVDGRLLAGPHELIAGEFALEYVGRDGWSVTQGADVVVAVDTRIDPELQLEGRALDVIHQIQRLRRDSGLEITDRIEIHHDVEPELDRSSASTVTGSPARPSPFESSGVQGRWRS